MIRKIFRRAKNNEMLNTSFYTGIGTAIGFISGFVVNKVIAVLIGPSGIAIVSQFQNFISITTSISTGGIQQGVVKYVAEVREQKEKKAEILSTALKITLISTILVGVLTAIYSGYLSSILFDSNEYKTILIVFGGTVVLFGLNRLLISILNGNGEIKKLVAVKISTNLMGLVLTITLAFFYSVFGALLALALSQSVVFFLSLVFVIKSDWFQIDLFNKKIDKENVLKLLKYTLMAVSSMVIPPLVQIGIRNHISETLTIAEAGYWDGLWKISKSYLGLITSTLSIYYLPKLSSLKESKLIRRELLNGYKLIAPTLLVGLFIIYFAREYIILILYSDEFMKMEKLFFPQLIGDFFMVMAWLIGYIMLAKAKTKLFIGMQLYSSAVTYFLSVFLINVWGLEGVVWAHAYRFIFHFLLLTFLLRKYLRK